MSSTFQERFSPSQSVLYNVNVIRRILFSKRSHIVYTCENHFLGEKGSSPGLSLPPARLLALILFIETIYGQKLRFHAMVEEEKFYL
jgi:hypothetical protein